MRNAFVLLLAGLFTLGCDIPTPVDPSVKTPLTMSVVADYTTSPVSLRLRGSVFKSTAGPQDTPFNSATVYISTANEPTRQLSTTQTVLPLPMLLPGKTYAIYVTGKVGNYTSSPSNNIQVWPDVLPATRTLMPYNRQWFYYLAPNGLVAIRQRRDEATGQYLTQTVDTNGNSQAVDLGGFFFCVGWDTGSQRAFFETSRANKRAFVSYDPATNTSTNIALPADAEVWNYAIAPDGKQVVFTDYKRRGLFYFDTRTKVQKTLNGPNTIYDMSFTADSQSLLLTAPALPSAGLTDKQLVLQYDPQTDQKTTLITGFPGISNARLSPDGRFLLFVSTLSGGGALWLQNQQTQALRPVSNSYRAGWLNDGTFWTNYEPTSNAVGPRESTFWLFKP